MPKFIKHIDVNIAIKDLFIFIIHIFICIIGPIIKELLARIIQIKIFYIYLYIHLNKSFFIYFNH